MYVNGVKENKNSKNVYPFDEAVSLCGYGWYNVYILVAIGLCLMDVIMETMGVMFVIPAAQCDLNLTLTEKSVLSAISFLGVVSSSHLWGFIADTKGRKYALISSMILSFVTTAISSLIPDPWVFIFVRFLNGFFVAGSSAAVYAYVGEFHDKTYRPKVVSWLACFVAFGNMLLPILGWFILPMTFSFEIPCLGILFRPWRLMVVSYGVFGLLAALCVYILPESPKFLLTIGKHDEALEVLRKIYSYNTGNDGKSFPVSTLTLDEQHFTFKKENLLKTMWKQTRPLFIRNYLLKTILVCLLQFGAFFSSSGLLMWYPEILNKMTYFNKENPRSQATVCGAIEFYEKKSLNFNTTESSYESICEDTVDDEVFMISLVMGSAFALSYVFIGTFINIIGKNNLLLGFFLITTSFGLATQYVHGITIAQIFIGIFLLEGTCIGIINAVVVDLYPTQLRGMALAISLMAGRFGAVAGANLSGPVIYHYCDFTFYMYTFDHLVLIAIVLLLPFVNRRSEKMIQPLE